MSSIRVVYISLITSALVAACSSKDDGPEAWASSPLTLAAVPWNPSNVDVGTAQATVEQDKSVLIFSSKGLETIVSGSLVSSDGTITSWKSAALVPSPDGLATWTVGVDTNGRVQRVATDGPPTDVSDRYGLADTAKVSAVASGTSRVAFLTDTDVAISDGANVTHFPVVAHSLAAATSGPVAIADGGAIRIFEQAKPEKDITLADAQLVAYDGAGNLVAATTHGIYRVIEGNTVSAQQIFDAGTRTIHQLVGAGSAVWFTIDGDLGMWKDEQISIASNQNIAPDGHLVGSPSGDVWVLTGGQLLRWSAQGAAGGDEATWNTTVLPIYAAVCSNCHSPAGSGKDSSNVDLSTYAAWNTRRDLVYQRAVAQAGTASAMPPPTSTFTLTDAQRASIAAWAKPTAP